MIVVAVCSGVQQAPQPNHRSFSQHFRGVSQQGRKDADVCNQPESLIQQTVDTEGWTYTMWCTNVHMHTWARTHSPGLSKQPGGTTLSESVPAWSISNTHADRDTHGPTRQQHWMRVLLAQCQHGRALWYNCRRRPLYRCHQDSMSWLCSLTRSPQHTVLQNRWDLSGLSSSQHH